MVSIIALIKYENNINRLHDIVRINYSMRSQKGVKMKHPWIPLHLSFLSAQPINAVPQWQNISLRN
jgi:hypothetical protein